MAAAWLLIQAAVPCLADTLTLDADSQYDYARSRLDAGAFEDAINEFNRFIHFFPEDQRVLNARFYQGTAHFRIAAYESAADIFASLATEAMPTKVGIDAIFMLSKSHARQGNLDQAVLDLHNLIAIYTDADIRDRAQYEMAWLHMDRGHWRDAETAIHRIRETNRQRYKVAELENALARRAELAYKNPTTAGILSIVPGGGQLYCRRHQDALTAFLLNTGLIWAAWESFDREQYALGCLISFIEAGFYAGNIYGAVSGAHKINRDRMIRFRKDLESRRLPTLSLVPIPGGSLVSLTIDF